MKRPLTLSAFAVIVPLAALSLPAPAALAQEQLWTTQIGTSGFDTVDTAAPDGAGGVFVGGFTDGLLGAASLGGRDGLIARYDGAGNQLWLTQFGTADIDDANEVMGDGAGGVFVTGSTNGSYGGPSAGGRDAFIARFDQSGVLVWVRQFGTNGVDVGTNLTSDGAGGIYVSGYTDGSLGTTNLGGLDVFLAHYDGSGNWMSFRQMGSTSEDFPAALEADGAGGVFIGGSTRGGWGGQNQGGPDAFLTRVDAAGTFLWTEQFGSAGTEVIEGLAADGAGGVMIAGSMNGAGFQLECMAGRFDGAGKLLWITQFGQASDDSASALTSDGLGGFVFAGWTEGSLGGPHAGGIDGVLTRFDIDGNRTWVRQFGSAGDDYALALASDSAGGVIIAGYSFGDLGGPNAGQTDIFLTRYSGEEEACYADCDQSTGAGVLDIFDFLCFQDAFIKGCP